MTTSHSPLRALKAQADKIAAMLKAVDRGEKVDVRFADHPAAARAHRKRRSKHYDTAESAHNDLNMFYAIISMLESGSMSSDSQADQFAIIKRATAAAYKCLRRYDRAHAALEAAERAGE